MVAPRNEQQERNVNELEALQKIAENSDYIVYSFYLSAGFIALSLFTRAVAFIIGILAD